MTEKFMLADRLRVEIAQRLPEVARRIQASLSPFEERHDEVRVYLTGNPREFLKYTRLARLFWMYPPQLSPQGERFVDQIVEELKEVLLLEAMEGVAT